MIAGAIGIFSIVSVSLLLMTRTPESSLVPYCTPSPSAPLRNELMSVEKAQEKVPFRIIKPKYLPIDFTFLGARVSEKKITLIYEDSNGRRITISEWESNGHKHQPYPGEKEVTVNRIRGWFSIPGPYNLRWDCDDLAISLTTDLSGGSEAVMDEMIKIAESMQC